VEELAERLAEIPGVVAVALGGSRAQGKERPDSDWDFGLYYRGSIDPDDVRALGYAGEVFAPGEWAYPMNGGAWLTVDGQRVDLIYRDLDDVERWVEETDLGRWELYRVPGYLCGMASYVLAGELALGRVLVGALPSAGFPSALRSSAPARWRWESGYAIEQAEIHARRNAVAGCFGALSVAILAESHARLCERGEWVLNEKRLAERAGLGPLERRFLAELADGEDLAGMVAPVASGLSGA
jgi:predicted nucleotidyltransferase